MNNPMLDCSPQIFAHKKYTTDNLIPLGTGVLLRNQNGSFLITAKHISDVIDKYDLFILLVDRPIKITGQWAYVNTNRQHDNIDISILKFDEEMILPILTTYKFIIEDILNDVKIKSDDNLFVVMGFPVNRTTVTGRNFVSEPFGFITQQKHLKKMKKISLFDEDNIIVRYCRKEQGFLDAVIKSQGPKDLRGISGGGLWHFKGKNELMGLTNLSLSGIVIEADINRGIICATRPKWIRILLDGFAQTNNII